MRRLILISLLAASAQLFTGALAMAQTPSPALPNQALYDPQGFLPPAPAWDGASRALLLPGSDPWATDF